MMEDNTVSHVVVDGYVYTRAEGANESFGSNCANVMHASNLYDPQMPQSRDTCAGKKTELSVTRPMSICLHSVLHGPCSS